ncbi:MAG: PaaI family thioesterase [Halobacteriota archaeon]
MDGLTELLNDTPFVSEMGIELTAAADGKATGRLTLRARHSSVPGRQIAHGGVAYALADTVGGAAVLSLHGKPTPTIDMRIDYLAPAQTDLHARAEVVRDGGSVTVVDVHVRDTEGTRVAEARGAYKTSGGNGDTAWGNPTAESGEAADDHKNY